MSRRAAATASWRWTCWNTSATTSRCLPPSSASLKPGGDLLITVPAFQFLFSGQDDRLKHLRRYDKDGLNALLRTCYLQPVELFYFYASLFVVRLIEKGSLDRGAIEMRTALPTGGFRARTR